MSATPAQRSASAALVRLDPTRAGFRGSHEVEEHLRALRIYLESWVFPHLERAAGTLHEQSRPHIDRDAYDVLRIDKYSTLRQEDRPKGRL